MSNRQKGRKAEKEAEKNLIEAGWDVVLTDMPHRWKKNQDFMGLFDILAFKGPYLKLIQVKSNKKPSKKDRIIMKEWGDKHPNPYYTVEWWTRYDNKPMNERWDTFILWSAEDI